MNATSKPKHTPGPYSISGITGDYQIMSGYLFGEGRKTVAIIPGWPGITPEEHASNMTLFRAAPELFRCLANLCAELRLQFETVPAGVDAWIAESCIAIEKAQGNL